MIELFLSLINPDTWNRWRIKGKIKLSRLAYSIIILFAVDTIIAAKTNTLLHPAIAIAGLLWIMLVAAVIWYRGGAVIDALFGAEIINLEIKHELVHATTGRKFFRPGHDFMRALALLGMVGVFVTSFFLLVPIWQSWSLFFALLVVLIGWRCAATLTESTFNWNSVRKVYIVFTVVAVGMIFLLYCYGLVSDQALTVSAVRATLQSSIGGITQPATSIFHGSAGSLRAKSPGTILFILALAFLVPGIILVVFTKKGRALIIVGTIILISALVWMGWGPGTSQANGMASTKKSQSQSTASAPAREIPERAEVACTTVVVPAGRVVDTQFHTRPDQRVSFKWCGMLPYDRNSPLYYIHGSHGDLPVFSTEFSCNFSNCNDSIWVKGGAITASLTLSK